MHFSYSDWIAAELESLEFTDCSFIQIAQKWKKKSMFEKDEVHSYELASLFIGQLLKAFFLLTTENQITHILPYELDTYHIFVRRETSIIKLLTCTSK